MKAVIFDMDGVLVDSMPDHAEAWKRVFAEVGIGIEREAIYELEGSNHRQIVDIIFRRSCRIPTEKDVRELTEKKVEIFNKIERVKPFDGMKELLAALAPRFRLAVVSGSNRTTVHGIINTFFPGRFQVVIDGEETEKSKPAPDPYLKALEKLGIPAEHCLVIENAPLGIRSAKSAGLRCIAIPTYLGRESLKEADVIAESHGELARIIREEEEREALHDFKTMGLQGLKGDEQTIEKYLF